MCAFRYCMYFACHSPPARVILPFPVPLGLFLFSSLAPFIAEMGVEMHHEAVEKQGEKPVSQQHLTQSQQPK